MAENQPQHADYVAELEAEVSALRSLVQWATDREIVEAAGTPEEIAAARRAYVGGSASLDDPGHGGVRDACRRGDGAK